jgi:histidyl-tRNA synthetase
MEAVRGKTYIQEKAFSPKELDHIITHFTDAAYDNTIIKGFQETITSASTAEIKAAISSLQPIPDLAGFPKAGEHQTLYKRNVLYVLAIFIAHHRHAFSKEQAAVILAELNSSTHEYEFSIDKPASLFEGLFKTYSLEQLELIKTYSSAIFEVACYLAFFMQVSNLSVFLVATFCTALEATSTDSKFIEEIKSWKQNDNVFYDLLTKIENFMACRNCNSTNSSTLVHKEFLEFLFNYQKQLDLLKKGLKDFVSVDQNHSRKQFFWQTKYPLELNSIRAQVWSCAQVLTNKPLLRSLVASVADESFLDSVRAQILDEVDSLAFQNVEIEHVVRTVVVVDSNFQSFISLVSTLASASVYTIQAREAADLERAENTKSKVSFKLGRGVEHFYKRSIRREQSAENLARPASYAKIPLNLQETRVRDELAAFFERSNQESRIPVVPKGVRDTDPAQMRIKRKAFEIIIGIYNKHGAVEIDTPVFELKETLLGKYGEEAGKLIYDLSDQGGQLLSLRYDLTVPFARYLATNNLKKFKRYHIGKVYRRDQPDIAKGRYREFYQCDLDIAGHYDLMTVDAEILSIMDEVMAAVDIGPYTIKLCHRVLLEGIVALSGAPPTKFKAICATIDKLDKEKWEDIRKELIEQRGLEEAAADKVGTFVNHKGTIDDMVKMFEQNKMFEGHQPSLKAIEELKLLSGYLKSLKAYDNISLDLSLARGLDYYTGLIFEIVCHGANVGSVGGGGRYDNLVGMFGAESIPCTGFSIGIERIFTLLEEKYKRNNTPIRENETQFLVATIGQNLFETKLSLLKRLWSAGFKAECSYETAPKPKNQQAFAYETKIPFIIWLGEEEMRSGTVKIKVVL